MEKKPREIQRQIKVLRIWKKAWKKIGAWFYVGNIPLFVLLFLDYQIYKTTKVSEK